MARPRRNTDPDQIRLVTIRTERAALLMRPDPATNEIIGGIVAKYQEKFSIEIFAFVFLSNHFHLLVRAPKGNLWRFLQAVDREIARRINRLRNRRGHFWRRRYDEQTVVTERDALEGLLYVVTNPVHHGLVEHPRHWPGLVSYAELLGKGVREFKFTNYTLYAKAKRIARATGEKVRLEDFQTKHQLTISPLPQFASLSAQEHAEKLSTLIESRVQNLRAQRKRDGHAFLGRAKILSQSPFAIPRKVSNSPRPLCYTRCMEARRIFMESYRAWANWYIKASALFRAGNFLTEFPPHSIRPPLLYCSYTISGSAQTIGVAE